MTGPTPFTASFMAQRLDEGQHHVPLFVPVSDHGAITGDREQALLIVEDRRVSVDEHHHGAKRV